MGRRVLRSSWSGPQHPGRCRATNSPPLIPNWSTPRCGDWAKGKQSRVTRFWIASALVDQLASKAKFDFEVEARCMGSKLVGRRYVPPFDYYMPAAVDDSNSTSYLAAGQLKSGGKQHVAWRVVAADFVTTDTGTGIVHQAPAFGEVDFEVLLAEQARFVDGQGPQLICAVGPDGKFTAEAPDYQGRWVKDCDKDIIRDLKRRGLLVPSRAIPARLSVLLAGRRGPAHPVSAQKLVHPHDAVPRRDAGQQRARSTGCRNTSATAASAIFWNRTSIGPFRANAIGARRCRSGSAKRPATWRPSARTKNCGKSRVRPDSKFGKRRKRRIPRWPITCESTSRISTR